MTDKEIKEITEEVNKRIHIEYPCLVNPIQEWMVKEILKVVKK